MDKRVIINNIETKPDFEDKPLKSFIYTRSNLLDDINVIIEIADTFSYRISNNIKSSNRKIKINRRENC